MPHTTAPAATPEASGFVHPFICNGDQLLLRHARQCAQSGSWKAAAHDVLYAVHDFFAPRFATSVLAGTAVVLCAMALT